MLLKYSVAVHLSVVLYLLLYDIEFFSEDLLSIFQLLFYLAHLP